MALELRQQLKLSQQLVMTPQLQQAIKLLQLSRLELLETVQQELLENPFLEEATEETPAAQAEESRPSTVEDSEAYAKEAARNADWEDYLGDFSSTSRQSSMRETEAGEDGLSFEGRYANKPTLEGHLNWQLRLSRLNEEEMAAGEAIIGNLSSTGYLHASLAEVATLAAVPEETAERVLKIIQRFDPVGVAARTPQECLKVQLEVLNYDRDPILLSLVTEHLEDLESRRYKPILRKFKLSTDDLKEYLDIIQNLDPLPGASFGSGEPTYVSPDVFVYRLDDEFVIALNDDGLPQLHLSSVYEDSLQAAKDTDKEYFQEKMRSAAWLVKSLYQRQRTLYKVTESIVRFQKEFFLHGVSHLKPLILKDIAEDISMHESTVSRITSNKYAATPFGIYELKFFFNSALSLDDGSEVGSESVKDLIKKYISAEDPKEPLSDERIGELLKEDLKVNIARRTVAKYRTTLGIASSSKRRAFF
ncbi:RNA polymerase factor sigma-54 [Desulfovibrio sp. OttesenSCG-928-F20]|nr:RNA polymerase factor sigma-54 [Desulfovibrio sp. OttesenSCG-928-M16]MDL2290588.1 RNA polymerase factor sigma-54 [Desulfovibrio sp. OttesenSCG-928-F20]